jgi:hypothetical protein
MSLHFERTPGFDKYMGILEDWAKDGADMKKFKGLIKDDMKLHRFIDVWMSKDVDFIPADGKATKADAQAKLAAIKAAKGEYPEFFGSVALGRYTQEDVSGKDQIIRRFWAKNSGANVELSFEKADNYKGKTTRSADLTREYSTVVCEGKQVPFFQSYTEGAKDEMCYLKGSKTPVALYLYPGKLAAGVDVCSYKAGEYSCSSTICSHDKCALTEAEEQKELGYMTFWWYLAHEKAHRPIQYVGADGSKEPKNANEFFEWGNMYGDYQSWRIFAGFWGQAAIMIWVAMVANCAQSWFSMLLTKTLSSLAKNIAQAVAFTLVVLVEKAFLKVPQERVGTQWADLIIGTLGVVLSSLMFANLPKAPRPDGEPSKH